MARFRPLSPIVQDGLRENMLIDRTFRYRRFGSGTYRSSCVSP